MIPTPFPCCFGNDPVVIVPPETNNNELREDGSDELREDGSIELRENN